MKKFRYALAILLGSALFATACGGSDALVLCTDAPYPPMEMEIDGEFTGFDIELMRAIASELGRDLEVNNIGFDPITSGLAMESGECEIAAASITITAERAENINFSDPYFTADQSLLVAAGSGITNLAGFAGKNLGVQTGTTGEIYANANDPGATIISFENPGDIFTALAAGEVEGVLQDIVPNAEYVLNNPNDAELVETYPTDESYGFAVKKEGSEDLLREVNEALAKLVGDGTYDRIYNDWF